MMYSVIWYGNPYDNGHEDFKSYLAFNLVRGIVFNVGNKCLLLLYTKLFLGLNKRLRSQILPSLSNSSFQPSSRSINILLSTCYTKVLSISIAWTFQNNYSSTSPFIFLKFNILISNYYN